MKRLKYRVIKDHKASFPYSMYVVEGDEVSVGMEDPDMPGWFWCKDMKGVEAWIPSTHITINGSHGFITQDYNSCELDALVGETVQFLGESLGWIECLNKEWKYGWIPLENVELIDSARDYPGVG